MKQLKVLWITNQLFPEISEEIGEEIPKAGGWMYGLANSLKKDHALDLHIASAFDINQSISKKIDGTWFYLIPSKKPKTIYDPNLEKQWRTLVESTMPDIIHIHGSEYAHGLACMNAMPNQNYVLSIQGLINACAKRYYAGISKVDITKNITLRDMLRVDTIFNAKWKFKKRGGNELKYLKQLKHVMGRTDWDYAVTKSINPSLKYHHCDETLRSSFYTSEKWKNSQCEKQTIFISQAYYPLKGLHQLIKALAIVSNELEGFTLKIAGGNIINRETFKDRLKLTGYGKYILKLLKKHKLENNIKFLGILSEDEMRNEYLKSNIFICPSSIENSSNSIAEAQLLGVPCIASYVGGNNTLISHKNNGLLYPFDDIELLAHYVIELFNSEKLCEELSKNAIEKATERHDAAFNVKRTIEIYKNIVETQ